MKLFEKAVLILIFLLIIPIVNAQNCNDYDGGLNYFQKSYVRFYGVDYWDRCIDSKILIEGYCDQVGNLILTTYTCPNSCVDGACASITTTTTTTTIPPEGPCSTEGDYCYYNDDVSGYCVRKVYYDSHSGWFKELTGNYSCGANYCCIACAKNDCCWGLRGYCYSFDTNSPTGCYGSYDVSGYSYKCGEMNGEECVDDTTGYYLIDPSGEPPYGGVKCVASTSPDITTTSTTTSTVRTTTTTIITTTTTTREIMTTTTSTTSTTIQSTTTRTATTTSTSSTVMTTSTTTSTIEGITLSCGGSPNHGCSEVLDIYSIDTFLLPDSANCGDSIEVNVQWTGFHGYNEDCEPNYWGFFLETSPGSYSFLGSCQSSYESDCLLEYPNTYVMKYNVKMPSKGVITDGTYNIFITGETYNGYCNPFELNPNYNPNDPQSFEYNVDFQLSTSINLKNCGLSLTTTSYTTTTIFGSTTTTTRTTTSTTTTRMTTTTTTTGLITTTTTTPAGTTTTTISGDGGGGGCPILEAFNGKEFIEIEKLNIHAPKDKDTTYTSTFTMQPINEKYELILREASYLFWDGSHIDSVKLTDESGKECRLISAVHSKDGDVSKQLIVSDDIRVRSFPGDEIKLTYSGCSGETFSFKIVGYNMAAIKLNVTSTIAIVIVLALIVLLIIFGILKLTKSKEPTPQYSEESSEQPFY